MKLTLYTFLVASMLMGAEAIKVQTLPDVRATTPTEAEIKAHEDARAEAAKVVKNPQAALLQSIKDDLAQINNDMSFGVSFSQR